MQDGDAKALLFFLQLGETSTLRSLTGKGLQTRTEALK